MRENIILKVIGTAQDGGVPQANCQCNNCRFAYANPKLQRLSASLALILPDTGTWHLIDATPNFNPQIHIVKQSYPHLGLMDSIFLTHAHIGHYTGLMFLGREAISSKNLKVYAGEKMEVVLQEHVPWKQLVELKNIEIHSLESEQTITLESELKITPLEVPHRNEYSETFGFIISSPDKKVLYIPDIDRWDTWNKDIREIVSIVDLCLLDGTFYTKEEVSVRGRDSKEIPHPPIYETMDLLQDIVDSKSTEVYFTHFNHTNPVVDPNSSIIGHLQSRGFHIAQEGMEIIL